MQQTSSTSTLPITSIDQNANQNGLIQVLAQAVQQQQRQHHHNQQQQQQLILQPTLGQNPLGQLLQSQTPLQPASLDGFAQLLAQAQQQQQQQLIQQQQQQLILLQHLLNQQNVLSSDSLQTNLSSLAPSSASQRMLPSNRILLGGASTNYSSAPQSALATNNNISQNLQQQSNLPNSLLLGSILSNLQNQPNNIGMLSAPQGAQQLDQLQRSLMLQQHQLLASVLSSSNQSVNQQPQQPTWEQIALLGQIQNSQNPPPINAQPSVNAAFNLTRQEDSVDEEHSVSEEKST
jgi:5'-3' exonuclease